MVFKAEYSPQVLGDLTKIKPKDLTNWFNDLNGTQARKVVRLDDSEEGNYQLEVTDVPMTRLKSTKGFIRTFSYINQIRDFCVTKEQRKAFNDLLSCFDSTEDQYKRQIDRAQKKVDQAKDKLEDEQVRMNELKNKVSEANKDKRKAQEKLGKYKERQKTEKSKTVNKSVTKTVTTTSK